MKFSWVARTRKVPKEESCASRSLNVNFMEWSCFRGLSLVLSCHQERGNVFFNAVVLWVDLGSSVSASGRFETVSGVRWGSTLLYLFSQYSLDHSAWPEPELHGQAFTWEPGEYKVCIYKVVGWACEPHSRRNCITLYRKK